MSNKWWLPGMIAVMAAVPCAAQTSAQIEEIHRVWESKYADHLPEFCLYTMQFPDHKTWGLHKGPISMGKYLRMYGAAWEHMHHYCYGLEDMYTASRTPDEALSKHLYGQAIIEIDYVLERSEPDYILRAELLFKKGVCQMMIGDPLSAVESYSGALLAQPDYIPAYVALSAYFERAGDLSEAQAMLTRGLTYAPDSKVLNDRLAELRARASSGEAENPR